MAWVKKKKGWKMGLNCFKLLKTNIEKMSAFRLSKIFMKTNELAPALQDIDENKGESRLAQQRADSRYSFSARSAATACNRSRSRGVKAAGWSLSISISPRMRP